MKTSFQDTPIHPALFRIAAIIGDPITPINGISTWANLKKEFEAFRKEIAKSRAKNIAKSQPKTPVTEACEWSFPICK